jgi:hypothetical protein
MNAHIKTHTLYTVADSHFAKQVLGSKEYEYECTHKNTHWQIHTLLNKFSDPLDNEKEMLEKLLKTWDV